MPETNAVERILLRKDSPTDEEWQALISERTERMRPIMDRLTLTKIEDVEFTKRHVGKLVTLNDHRDELQGKEDILNQQGIFDARYVDKTSVNFVIWGLLRNGAWYVCGFNYVTVTNTRYAVSDLWAVENNPWNIEHQFGVHYRQMWYLLSKAVHEFAEQRRHQLRTIERLERQFEHEDSLIKPFVR